VRRSIAVALAGLALLAFAVPAQATTRVKTILPARSYEIDVCGFPILAEERSGHPGYLTLNDAGEVVGVQFKGSFDTVLSSSKGNLTIETTGSTSVTDNGDGTWTMVQKGSGLAVVPGGAPIGPTLLWFTGTVTTVGTFDPKTLEFTPISQVRDGITADVCGMLVTGLKHRHDTL
jgi:hypothetical protein